MRFEACDRALLVNSAALARALGFLDLFFFRARSLPYFEVTMTVLSHDARGRASTYRYALGVALLAEATQIQV